VPVTLCGEMAGKPLESMVLLGLGLRSISMSPASIGPVKSMILSLDLQALETFMIETLATKSGSLREPLQRYARDKKVHVEAFKLI